MAVRETRREWDRVTLPYCADQHSGDVVLGEVPIRTGGGKTFRRVDAVAFRRPGRGAALAPMHLSDLTPGDQRHWLGQLRGGSLTVIQTKVERVGFSVLGQTLMSVELVREQYEPRAVRGLALGTDIDPTLARIVARPPYSGLLSIAAQAGEAVTRATREAPKAPQLLGPFEAPSRSITRARPHCG